MSSNFPNSSITKKSASGVDNTQNHASPSGKGKTKADDPNMKEGEEGEDDEDDEEEEDEEEEMGSEDESDGELEKELEEIDPKAIMPSGRRTRGVRVDYSSKEALAKAGLEDGPKDDEDDEDEDVEMGD